MPVTPIEPSEATLTPFITTQELSDYLGRNVMLDAAGTFAIEAACGVVRTFTEQRFNRGTTTYAFDGTGTDVLLFPDLPVNSAGSAFVNGGSISDFIVNDKGALFRGTAGADPRPVWPVGRQNVVITADHGYNVVDIPNDVRMVALAVAARFIVQGPASEESIGTTRVKYAVSSTDLTSTEQIILRKHKPS